jgi:hypothetical protein
MTINSRRKGKRGELEAAAAIREAFGTNARRSAQHCGMAGQADLVDAIPGCHVEVKNVAAIAALKYHDQAARDAKPGSVPVVVMRGKRRPWFVLLTLADFARLTKKESPDAG